MPPRSLTAFVLCAFLAGLVYVGHAGTMGCDATSLHPDPGKDHCGTDGKCSVPSGACTIACAVPACIISASKTRQQPFSPEAPRSALSTPASAEPQAPDTVPPKTRLS